MPQVPIALVVLGSAGLLKIGGSEAHANPGDVGVWHSVLFGQMVPEMIWACGWLELVTVGKNAGFHLRCQLANDDP